MKVVNPPIEIDSKRAELREAFAKSRSVTKVLHEFCGLPMIQNIYDGLSSPDPREKFEYTRLLAKALITSENPVIGGSLVEVENRKMRMAEITVDDSALEFNVGKRVE